MTKTFDARHHAVHPPSKVAPNLAVNPKPNYVPPEKAALPNPNPSLGSVGVVDGLNARRPGPTPLSRRQDSEAVSNPDSPAYDPESDEYDPTMDSSSDEFDEDRNDAEIQIS